MTTLLSCKGTLVHYRTSIQGVPDINQSQSALTEPHPRGLMLQEKNWRGSWISQECPWWIRSSLGTDCKLLLRPRESRTHRYSINDKLDKGELALNTAARYWQRWPLKLMTPLACLQGPHWRIYNKWIRSYTLPCNPSSSNSDAGLNRSKQTTTLLGFWATLAILYQVPLKFILLADYLWGSPKLLL